MKKTKIILVILCVALFLSGCHSFRFASSIEDLMSPVTPSGKNAEVQSALSEYCGQSYSIKVPSGGEYKTAYIFNDLDNDGVEEAIAFYEPGDSLGTAKMAILFQDEKEWIVVDEIVGEGSDVNAVDFSDLDGDGISEIVVSWSVISKSNVSYINAYQKDSEKLVFENMASSIVATDFICVDINDNGIEDLLVLSTGSSAESPFAQLYTFENGYVDDIGFTKLDNSIMSFSKFTVGETEEGTSVYIDALRADGSSMVTEFIYWSDYYDSIVSPLYSYSTGKTADTTRANLVLSRDIDGDGAVEIPTSAYFGGLPDELKAEDWVAYNSTIFTHKCYSVSCKRDAYIIMLSDKEYEKLSFTYDADTRNLVAYKGDDICYSILALPKSSYESYFDDTGTYEKIFENSGYVYLAQVNADLDYTADYLADMIRAY